MNYLQQTKPLHLLIPSFSIGVFIILYLIAAYLYPGGSDVDKNSKTFNWLHNYWCNLLSENAINGEVNIAKPVAMAAMIVLCVGLSFFWYSLPTLFNGRFQKTIRYTGIPSIMIAIFIFTKYHDAIINIAGLLGLIALTTTHVGLYQSKYYKQFLLGLICLLMMLINNFIYHTGIWLYYLAIIQKITFLLVLLWFCLINIALYQKKKLSIINP